MMPQPYVGVGAEAGLWCIVRLRNISKKKNNRKLPFGADTEIYVLVIFKSEFEL